MAFTTLVEPEHTEWVLDRHEAKVKLAHKKEELLQEVRTVEMRKLQQLITEGIDDTASVKLAVIKNELSNARNSVAQALPISLTDTEKIMFGAEWTSYCKRKEKI